MKDFTKLFPMPFVLDIHSDYVFTANNQMVFQFIEDMKMKEQTKIVSIVNGIVHSDLDDEYRYDNLGQVVLNQDGKEILQIRGWGYLTGVGSLRLSCEEATKIQEDLGTYIVNRLNGKL